MRKSVEVPLLAQAIYSGDTTVSKARKICSVITNENAKEWIDLVIACPCRVVEKCVALANPRAAVQESLKYVSGDVLELKLAVSEEWAKLLTKTKDRLSQKEKRAVSTEEAIFILMRDAHRKDDPVLKAERAKSRLEKKTSRSLTDPEVLPVIEPEDPTKIWPTSIELGNALKTSGKSPKKSRHVPALVKHEVTLRDQGQCVHVNSFTGKRCENKRWIEQHHITEFAHGGEHTLKNLETLCWAHHRMRHAAH